MGTPRSFTFSTYHPDDPAIVGKDNRAKFTQGCDALHDAVWRLAERVGAEEHQLSAQDALWLLQDRPSVQQIAAAK